MNEPAAMIAENVRQADQRRIEQLLAMTAKIADALATDIAALEAGRFDALSSADPEIARLCAIFGREVAALKASETKLLHSERTTALKAAAARLNKLLARHQTLVAAMRKASEGLVQAIASEVQKSRDKIAPYRATPKAKRAETPAIIYNKVI